MLGFLFPRLTPRKPPATALFEALIAAARQPHWFVEGGVPDTIDGRFAVLSTLCALASVKLEQISERDTAVALAERFVEAMDAEHRQLGIGEPTIGKKVRKMATALGRRVELWRGAVEAGSWSEAARTSLFGDQDPDWAALDHDRIALQSLWERFAVVDLNKGEVW